MSLWSFLFSIHFAVTFREVARRKLALLCWQRARVGTLADTSQQPAHAPQAFQSLQSHGSRLMLPSKNFKTSFTKCWVTVLLGSFNPLRCENFHRGLNPGALWDTSPRVHNSCFFSRVCYANSGTQTYARSSIWALQFPIRSQAQYLL